MKMDDDSEVIGWEDCDEMKINKTRWGLLLTMEIGSLSVTGIAR
jgi:hypothetical protein